MDSGDTGTPAAPHSEPRPSLLGNNQPAITARQKPTEAISILSSLENGTGRRIRRSGTNRSSLWVIMFGTLFAITVAAAVVLALSRDTSTRATVPVSYPQPMPPVTIASAPAATGTENSTATIEDAPAVPLAPQPSLAPPQTDTVSNAAPPPLSTVSTTEKPAQVPIARDSKPQAITLPPPQGVVTGAEKGERATADARVLPATQKDVTGELKTNNAKALPGSVTADRDASLLAALVAYSEGRPATEIQKSGTSGKSRPATQQQEAVSTSGNERTFDPKRDVVTKEGSVSTAELVRRCKMLGFFEGTLCRMRVCNNLWGKDPACPQPEGPQTNNP